MVLDLDENKFYSKTIGLWFPVTFSNAAPGFPSHIKFTENEFVRPPPIQLSSSTSLMTSNNARHNILHNFEPRE